jgi:hypothetical protein
MSRAVKIVNDAIYEPARKTTTLIGRKDTKSQDF